jgi:hypothetical protein
MYIYMKFGNTEHMVQLETSSASRQALSDPRVLLVLPLPL